MAKGKKKNKTAFGLVRVSTSEQDFQSQKDALRKVAESFGYTILDEREGYDFFSEKITGFDNFDSDRESILKLKDAIQCRKPDAIFIWELSRLTRNSIKVSKYINELSLQPKIPMYFADYKVWTIDPDTMEINSDAVMTVQGGAVGVELERKRIKERTSRGRDAKAEKGYYVGHLKDGYVWVEEDGRKVFKVDENRRPLIEKVYELYLDKQLSTREIRDFLNANIDIYPTPNRYRYLHQTMFKGYGNQYKDRSGNVLSRDEALWTDGMVSSVLRDEWYAGVRRYHNKPYTIEPIVSRKRWESCQERLNSFRPRISTAKHPYLLTKLLYCGICGRKMYVHSDGGYGDVYFCSSREYGKNHKCGLKMVKRQNLEAIMTALVRNRVYEDIGLGEKSPFSDFFSPNEEQLKIINESIRTQNKLIKNSEQKIKEYNDRVDFYIEQQGKYHSDRLMVERYDRKIEEINKSVEAENRRIADCKVSIDKQKKVKRMWASVKEKELKVANLKDYGEMKRLMNHVIDRIYLYNPDKATTVIEVKYVNGKTDTAIYCPSRMVKKFIFLSRDDKEIAPYVKYDKDAKVLSFKGKYFACGNNKQLIFDDKEESVSAEEEAFYNEIGVVPLPIWDTQQNRAKYVKKSIDMGIASDEAQKRYDAALITKQIWKDIHDAVEYCQNNGMSVFKDEMTVREYIDIMRGGTLNVYEISDILPMSKRGEELKKYHSEYLKRYNTGNPTFTPYIVKDVKYEEICKERKHLYNRKYKVLHNKHLSQQEKDAQIFEIMEKLEAYKYQIKYLPTNKKGRQHIEKYGEGEKDGHGKL